MFLLSGATAFAAARTENITISFNGIRLVVNGTEVTPRDGAGNVVEPFIWNGTTYLPVRAIATALGQEVDWDGNTQTVYIGHRDTTIQPAPMPTPTPTTQGRPLTEVAPFTQRHPSNESSSLNRVWVSHSAVIDGVTHNSVINFIRQSSAANYYTIHSLNGQYTILNGHVGRVTGGRNRDVVLNIVGDGRLLGSFDVPREGAAIPYSVNVSGVHELRVEMAFSQGGGGANASHLAVSAYLQ
jgi:hypothetical protein